MRKHQAFLLLVILFSLLFIALIAAGSYLLSIHSKQYGVAAFLFAFAAAFGQIASLALYIREIARLKAVKSLAQQSETLGNQS